MLTIDSCCRHNVRATGFCHKSYDTLSSRHVLLLFFHSFKTSAARRLSLSACLSELSDYAIMPCSRPISHRPRVDPSLPLLLRLDLGPRPRVFDSPPPPLHSDNALMLLDSRRNARLRNLISYSIQFNDKLLAVKRSSMSRSTDLDG